MGSAPSISVIVPTRNAASVIDACLESLRAQTYGGFEVLIVDAQSADDTLDKVRAEAARFGESLRCLSELDPGVYHAMNKGISIARHEWLYFLGADDVLHDPTVLADVAKILSEADADIVYGDVLEKHSRARYGGEFSLDRLLFDGNICHQAVFYRRAVFERLGGYSTRYPIWADWEFNIRCFRHPGVRARWMDRLIAVYQERAGLSREEDPVFRKELPASLLRETAALRSELAQITDTIWYRMYSRLFRRPGRPPAP